MHGNDAAQRADAARIAFVTLGCAKNEVDTASMEEAVLSAGYRVAEDPFDADAVVVNTCAFIVEATEESVDSILSLRSDLDDTGRHVPLVVAGCLPARYGDDLVAELSEADAFLPCRREGELLAVLADLLEDDTACAPEGDALCTCSGRSVTGRHANSGVSRYVKISDGCDRYCSFCAIPYIRGSYRSFSPESISARIEREISSGAREIVLIAQDTGRWGEDFDPPQTLAHLLDLLAGSHPETWFRVLYLEPEGATDELVRCVARHPNIAPYFDIPIQHVAPRVLRSMNRSGSAEEFLALYGRIRRDIPDAVLRTTLIAGFPGETEAEFDALMEFLAEAELDYVGVFPYSREEGTAAANLPGQIPEETKIERAQQIRYLSDALSESKLRAQVGKVLSVLVEGLDEEGHPYGRTMGQAPEVDGLTFVDGGLPGEVCRVLIEDTLYYDMEGTAR